MLCCSWRRSRVSLSFLAALPDDLRLDEVADLLTSPSRVAAPDGHRPLASPVSGARVLVERGDLADVDLLALPRKEPVLHEAIWIQALGTRPYRRPRFLQIQACRWSPEQELHLQRKSSSRCCSIEVVATSLHFSAVHLRLMQVDDL